MAFARIFAIALTLLTSACGQGGDPLVSDYSGMSPIRVAVFAPAHSETVTQVVRPWVGRLNDALPAGYRFELFTGGSLGRHPEAQLKMVRDRVTDCAYIIPSYTPGEFPDNGLFEIPLLMDNSLEASLAFYRLHQRGMLRGYSGLKALALFTTNPYYLHLASSYEGLDDLNGRKIRVTGFVQARIVEAFGGTPIGGIAVPQIAESMSRGLIDGTLLSWDLMATYGVTRVAKYHVDLPLSFSNLMLAMNKGRYDDLPPGVQNTIDRLSGEHLVRRFVDVRSRLAAEARLEAKQSREHHFIEPAVGELQRWRLRLAPILQEWTNNNPQGSKRLAALNHTLSEMHEDQP